MNQNSKIEITISSDLDYDNLIAEIIIDGQFIGLITNEPSQAVRFEIPEGQVSTVNVDFNILLNALDKAKRELLQ